MPTTQDDEDLLPEYHDIVLRGGPANGQKFTILADQLFVKIADWSACPPLRIGRTPTTPASEFSVPEHTYKRTRDIHFTGRIIFDFTGETK